MLKIFASAMFLFSNLVVLPQNAIAANEGSISRATAIQVTSDVSQLASQQKLQFIPVDVQQFEQEFNEAMMSGDVNRAAKFFSTRYLHNGTIKKVQEQNLAMLIMNATNYKLRLTSFKPITKNRAFISAEVISSFGNYDKKPDYQIIRENGKWRWLGNQKKTG